MDPLALLGRVAAPFFGRCRIPADVQEVVRIAREDPLEGTGVGRDAVEGVWRAALALYRTGVTPLLQLCVRRRGRIVLNRSVGHARGNAPGADPDGPREIGTPETPICLFSASKLVTAMAIHKLDELGIVHLEDRVCDVLPEFGTHRKQWITVRHLLSHRAGIPNLPGEAMDLDLLKNPDEVFARICELEPATRPGRLVAYHAVSGGFVMGELVRRASGMDLRSFVAKEFCEPLGLAGLRYGVAPAALDRVAENATTGPPPPPGVKQALERALGLTLEQVTALSNDPRFLQGIVPSANVVATAEETSRFLECMRLGGELDGTRILASRTIHHALNEASYREVDLTLMMPLRYGLGPMLGDDPVGIWGPHSARAFGHLGLSNILPWADPEREIAVALLTTGKPIISTHVVRLFQLVYAITQAFPKRDAASAPPD